MLHRANRLKADENYTLDTDIRGMLWTGHIGELGEANQL
jgi:hypothetical protein